MADGRGVPRRLTKETKGATKTTEFRLSTAHQAWLYVAILTGAYAVGRGIAKSGVREYPEDADELKGSRGEDRRDERGDDE